MCLSFLVTNIYNENLLLDCYVSKIYIHKLYLKVKRQNSLQSQERYWVWSWPGSSRNSGSSKAKIKMLILHLECLILK